MKKIVLTMSVWLCAMGITAQEFSVGADVVSSYVWRGAYQGGGASIQPSLTFSSGGFSIGAWGSSNFSGGNKEVDFSLAYAVGGVSLAITDYWWEGENALNYFNYHNAHHLEAGLSYTLPESFPLRLAWNTMFIEPDSQFSTYIEAAYPFEVKGVNLEATLGITPWEGIYADRLAISNISLKASKEIKITDSFSLPVFSQIILNPDTEDIFLVFGISLK
ncbi:MAG: hypothetical protein LBS46_02900 [Dysgonamonadaceae bacterium]|jgi:hypothetical protein|nr:hypothetical protein [Dysgonamonadaceae bacterium]